MDANQPNLKNPFGMDEECRLCPALCETRTNVVHGYGDVGAEFLFVGERPNPSADETALAFAEDPLLELLVDLEFLTDVDDFGTGATGDESDDSTSSELANAYLTNLTRCRHPERPPTDEEVVECDQYLTAEIRMINPEILVPIGPRALSVIADEYTTRPVEEFDIETHHATEIRGRGFEIVPMIEPGAQTEEQRTAFLGSFSNLLGRDYRQTKGRRGR